MKLTKKRIAHAHDRFFRMMMSEKRVSKEFFEAHLPPALLEVTDLNSLELVSPSHIDELRNESIADMLFKTKIDGHDAYLNLMVDHQSSPDELMPFRTLRGQITGIDTHMRETGSNRIPLVVPVVVYHGKAPWKYSTDVRDLVDAPRELVEQYFLKPFTLIDLSKIEDEALKQKAWASVLDLTLKHIRAKDMLPYLKDIFGQFRYIEHSADGKRVISIVIKYVLDRGRIADKAPILDLIRTELSPEVGDEMMTVAEQLRQEGWQEGVEHGVQQGLLEGAENAKRRMVARLSKKIKNLEEIADIAELPVEIVREYQRNCH
jgi:predicted transposase/invertase (TIGR01784 family)